MQKCSVIIVNYNTGILLKHAVNAALSNKSVIEIIVVDNQSNDESMSCLDEDKRLKKYYRKENHGFASSCNYGANLAKNDVFVFLNPDCIVTEESIDIMLEELSEHKKTGGIGCHVKNPNGSEQRASRRRLPTLWRAIKTYSKLEKLAKYCHCFAGVNLSHQAMPDKTQKVEAISGACIMIKAGVFNKVGMFDVEYPLHFEDLDLFKRIQNAGYDIRYNPTISVTHHQGTSSQSNPKVLQYKKQGLKRYFHQHCTLFSYYIIKVMVKFLR